MLYLVEDPKGKDALIQVLQKKINSGLSAWENIDVFGRVYRTPNTAGGYLPQAYIGNNEYRDVYTDDNKAATIFFIDGQKATTKEGIQFTTQLKIVFFVDLNTCFPGLSHRADSEAENAAMKVVRGSTFFDFTAIEKGVDVVFAGFDISKIKMVDMQKWYVFAIVGDLTYQENCF